MGNRNITNIDGSALDELDERRIEIMEKAPTHSTLLKHNAALNRVFDEAVIRGFLTEANRPKLETKGKVGDRRLAFDLEELRALLNNFDPWIDRALTDKSRELRLLLRDYVEMLVDAGARPGKELLNLKWRQIKFSMKPVITPTGQSDEDGDPLELANLNRSVEMTVSGKSGTRTIVGIRCAVQVLERIARRNYELKSSVVDPLAKLTVASNNPKARSCCTPIKAPSSLAMTGKTSWKRTTSRSAASCPQQRPFSGTVRHVVFRKSGSCLGN